MEKRIGFVILTWNSARVIEKCLKSIINLKEITPSIIIIDNGSCDLTCKIIERYKNSYPDKIKDIRYKENKGTTLTRNKGIEKLESEKLH